MLSYVVSLSTGVLVGIIYGLLNVRSPAPPVVALIGLLGMLLGEQVVPLAKRAIAGEPIDSGWIKAECTPHVLGKLPTGMSAQSARCREVQT